MPWQRSIQWRFIPQPPYQLGSALKVALPRIALYQSWVPSMDEGWTRYIFDQRHSLSPHGRCRIPKGNLNDRFDVIVLPDNSEHAITTGRGGYGSRSLFFFFLTLNNLSSVSLNPASKPEISGDATYYIAKAWGSHELEGGFYLQPHESSKVTTLYADGGTLTQENAVLNNASNPAAGYTIFRQDLCKRAQRSQQLYNGQ